MTEEEAKTKWCPFARAGITANERTDTREPGQVGPNAARCIGSACMAWRLSTPPKTRQESCGPQGGYRTVVIANGYCGLAGTPQ